MRPCSFATAWILVVRPPRDRPIAWFCSPFCARGRAVRPHRCAVDHGDPRRIGAGDEGGEDLLPEVALAPAIEPVEHRGSRAVGLGQRPQAQALVEPMGDAAQHPAIVDARLASEIGQQRLDRRPLRVVQPRQLAMTQASKGA